MPQANQMSDWSKLLITIGANALILVLGGAVAWGQNKQSVETIRSDVSRVQVDVKALADTQVATASRVTVLETNRSNADAKVDSMALDIKHLHDNVLILCKTSPQRDRCKD